MKIELGDPEPPVVITLTHNEAILLIGAMQDGVRNYAISPQTVEATKMVNQIRAILGWHEMTFHS